MAPKVHEIAVDTVGSTQQTYAHTSNFQMVSATWHKGALAPDAVLEVQVHSNGAWSQWSPLSLSDVGPDAGTADARGAKAEGPKDVSEPLWVGQGDGVAVRIESAAQLPSGLELSLIDPGTSAADAHPGAASASGAVAHAATLTPEVLTRADWGADESLRSHNPGCSTPAYSSTIKIGFVHHTATSNDYTPDQVPAILRSIYAYHVLSNGWCDIGYNFVIDKFGRIWEGRYGGIDQPVLGAHTGGFNTDSFGVALLGNFQSTTAGSTTPSDAMMTSLEQLLAWKLGMYGRNPLGTDTLTSAGGPDTRYPAGQQVTFNVVAGHRDAGDTLCPGDLVYNQLPAVRTATDTYMVGAALVDPKITDDFSPTSEPVVAQAGMLSPGTWTLSVANSTGAVVKTLTGSGSSVDAEWDRTDNSGARAPNGVYTLTLSSNQNGIDAVPWSTKVTLGRTAGAVDSDSEAPGRITLNGWALQDGDANDVTVRVVVDDGHNSTFVADVPRADVAQKYPEWGDNHGFKVTIPANPGSRHVCVYGINSGVADSQLDCRLVTVPGPAHSATDPAANPFGSFDTAAVTRPGTVLVRGWAIDPDTEGSIRVHVYVDNKGAASLAADVSRGDLAASFPAYGARHAFQTTLNVAGGTHQVCAYAINVSTGSSSTRLGCRTVTLPTGPPHGSYDAATVVGPGKVQIRGWDLDPDSVDPIRADVYVDGKGAASLTADGNRPDIAKIFPIYGPNHGFQTTLAMSGGKHQICVYAINVGPASGNPLLGCRTVTLPTGSAFGSFDSATAVAAGQIEVKGWDLDPDSADPIRADVYVDGKGAASLTADGDRPDIAKLFPGYGATHGFGTVLTVPAGKHNVCIWAINVGGGAPSTALGCKAVTVS